MGRGGPRVFGPGRMRGRWRRDAARDMFSFGWRGYMDHAFPSDDLRPLSCTGHDTQGGFGNTLVDSLDTLLVGDIQDLTVVASES